MLKSFIAAAALATLAAAVPATAATVIFSYLGAPNAIASSVVRVDNGVTLTATAQRFGTAPSLLTNVSDFTSGMTRTTSGGLGVNGGAQNATIDTNTASREAILVSGSRTLRLSGMLLNTLNASDTLQVYGVNQNSGALEAIGFGGTIRTGLAGAASFVNINSTTTDLTLNSLSPVYTQFVFTTRLDGLTGTTRQDYRIGTLTFAVPEPQSWALMIIGFGLVGIAARRRKVVALG
jgi:hypothetical protein